MARERGNENKTRPEAPDVGEPDGSGLLPDMARRALAFGLSGFFLTEEAVRKALGDTLPKDWQDFAIAQSERTRKEFLERLSYELAQTLENVDVAGVLEQLLAGRTIEIQAKVRLGKRNASGTRLKVSLTDDEAEE
jgi:hypothetical protein